MKIIYTRADHTETLASQATLRKILGRFHQRRVFSEMASRDRKGNIFFSTKRRFIVSSIEVLNRGELLITIFERGASSNSIELQNPTTMRVYEEQNGSNFAVAFVCESAENIEFRCYLREEGPADPNAEHSELEHISLPELFEYLEGLTSADALTDLTFSLEELVTTPCPRGNDSL